MYRGIVPLLNLQSYCHLMELIIWKSNATFTTTVNTRAVHFGNQELWLIPKQMQKMWYKSRLLAQKSKIENIYW